MSLSATYQAFLANPTAGALADNASINYITTLTTINEPAAIIKHLSAQAKLLKKKNEKVLSAIEGANGLCVDVETTLEFVSSGGAFLPGLDDNFVADRIVTFPMVHMVHFNAEQKISQIRLYWDQGSLLKQIDVIGARARNWPIRDGKEQARLIASSAAVASQPPSTTSSRRSTVNSRNPDEVIISDRPATSSSKRSSVSAANDTRAPLSLFQPRDLNQETSLPKPTVARVQSSKPPPREWSELFAGADEGESPSSSTVRSPSPRKQGIPVRAGGGKNFLPNRLFEEHEGDQTVKSPMSVKTNAKKYSHFDFGDEEDEQATPKVRETARSAKSRHQSQWDFEDFVTPEKVQPKVLGQAVRHFGWSDDEDDTSPIRRPVVHKPRPDQDAHFQFVDDGTPPADKAKHITNKGRQHNKGLGLYKDHVLGTSDDEGDNSPSKGDVKKHLGDVTTVINNENRKKDFGSQWEMTDASPNPQKTTFNGNENGNGTNKMPADRQKVLKGLDAHWGLYEPEQEQEKKENVPKERGIKLGGNGMGGRKGTEANWTFGDDGEDFPASKPVKPRGGVAPAEGKSFWDF